MTLVSVCIPTRNHAAFLADAVNSALAQAVAGLEVVVCDDASTDGTTQVLGAIRDDRLRVLRYERRVGVAAARNTCLGSARGRYVAWLDADDVYLDGSLGRHLALLDAHPDVGVAHAGFQLMDEQGRPLPGWPAPAPRGAVTASRVAFRQMITSNTMTTSTVVGRRAVFDQVGGFAGNLGRCGSDWHMWLRIAAVADVGYVAEPAARYRQHTQTITRGATRRERLASDRAVVADVLRRHPDRATPETVTAARSALAGKALFAAGDAATAGRRLEAVRHALWGAGVAPPRAWPPLLRVAAALTRGDSYAGYQAAKRALAILAPMVGETPFGERLANSASRDADYEASLARAASRIRASTPGDARIATVTKWDPTLLRLARRAGEQFPDRRELTDGYPSDDRAAVRQLELTRSRGCTHLVFTWATEWWLDYYPGFRDVLDASSRLIHRDDDCLIYELRR
jgi:hypothetical protein